MELPHQQPPNHRAWEKSTERTACPAATEQGQRVRSPTGGSTPPLPFPPRLRTRLPGWWRNSLKLQKCPERVSGDVILERCHANSFHQETILWGAGGSCPPRRCCSSELKGCWEKWFLRRAKLVAPAVKLFWEVQGKSCMGITTSAAKPPEAIFI